MNTKILLVSLVLIFGTNTLYCWKAFGATDLTDSVYDLYHNDNNAI